MNKVLIAPAPMRNLEHIWGPILRRSGLVPVLPEKQAQMTESELARQLVGCVATLAGSEPYTRVVIEAAAKTGLRAICRAGVGYDAVNLQAATDCGVVVGYAPGSNHEAVAEQTLMFVLALAKNLLPQHAATVAGQWPRRATKPVRGTTLGIVGLGRVGKAVALRAKPFGIHVIATEPFPDIAFLAANPIPLMSFRELLQTADWVTMHCPLTPETRRMINRDTLKLMKPASYLLNTARGEIIDEVALHEALMSNAIAGAALDVFENEPLKADHPFAKLSNVILTAHTAGVDAGSHVAMVQFAAEVAADLLTGKWPADRIVNPEVREKFKVSMQ